MKVHVSIQLDYGQKSCVFEGAVKTVLEAIGPHEIVDFNDADVLILSDATLMLKALKAGKRVCQFVWHADQAATGLLTSDFADRVRIFAPGCPAGETDGLFWLDKFVQYLLTLNPPNHGTEEVTS
jgi:hypothetical protein